MAELAVFAPTRYRTLLAASVGAAASLPQRGSASMGIVRKSNLSTAVSDNGAGKASGAM